jgi:hypothetical protein
MRAFFEKHLAAIAYAQERFVVTVSPDLRNVNQLARRSPNSSHAGTM